MTLIVHDGIIRDRGSRYAVSGGAVRDRSGIHALLVELKARRRFAKATHHSWAALLPDGPSRDDDGEHGAGALMVQMLERAELRGHLVIVTRWYGGRPLGGDRFRHVAGAVRIYLDRQRTALRGPGA